MWHKAIWKRHPMRLELIRVGLLVQLANHYTTRGANSWWLVRCCRQDLFKDTVEELRILLFKIILSFALSKMVLSIAGRPAFARRYVRVHRSTSLMNKSLLLQQNSSISNNSIGHRFSSIQPIDRNLSVATTPKWVNWGAMAITELSAFPKASPSDSFVSYLGHSLGESYQSAEMLSVYSAAATNWAISHFKI